MDKGVEVLILTASFGAGHNSVARAIREQILSFDKSVKVIIKDIFEITNPGTNQLMYRSYKYLITRHTDIYNYFYYQKKEHPYTLPDEIVYRINLRKFAEYFFLMKPSIIISTFPVCSGMVSRFKEKYHQKVPLVTCITDVVDSMEWVHDNTDLYFVPVEEVRRRLVCRGVQKQKIKVTGIPVRREFLMPNARGTDSGINKLNVLFMGGGFGSFEIDYEFLNWLDRNENIKTEIVTGLNRRLYNKLTRGSEFKNIKVYGYLENVAEHMDKADILISKPGGITIFEAVHKSVPIVVNQSTIGQEIENSKFITESGIGCVKKDLEETRSFLESSLDNKTELINMTENMTKITCNLEADMLGTHILNLL